MELRSCSAGDHVAANIVQNKERNKEFSSSSSKPNLHSHFNHTREEIKNDQISAHCKASQQSMGKQ